MANCPVCQSDISITAQHFGTLYTCPKCNAVFFVDWGGQPEAAASNESFATNEIPEDSQTGTPVFSEVSSEEDVVDLLSDEGPAVNQFGGDPLNFEAAPYEQEPIPHEALPPEEEAPVYEAAPAEEDQNYDFSQPLGAISTPEPMTPLTPEKDPLNDIADFGNADLGQAAFNYTITIAGIDSGALRNQIQEAITDGKFGWNVIQLMAQIKGGVLTIRSVNAVKASILIQRVKYLPVKISWRQDVLSSTV